MNTTFESVDDEEWARISDLVSPPPHRKVGAILRGFSSFYIEGVLQFVFSCRWRNLDPPFLS